MDLCLTVGRAIVFFLYSRSMKIAVRSFKIDERRCAVMFVPPARLSFRLPSALPPVCPPVRPSAHPPVRQSARPPSVRPPSWPPRPSHFSCRSDTCSRHSASPSSQPQPTPPDHSNLHCTCPGRPPANPPCSCFQNEISTQQAANQFAIYNCASLDSWSTKLQFIGTLPSAACPSQCMLQ